MNGQNPAAYAQAIRGPQTPPGTAVPQQMAAPQGGGAPPQMPGQQMYPGILGQQGAPYGGQPGPQSLQRPLGNPNALPG